MTREARDGSVRSDRSAPAPVGGDAHGRRRHGAGLGPTGQRSGNAGGRGPQGGRGTGGGDRGHLRLVLGRRRAPGGRRPCPSGGPSKVGAFDGRRVKNDQRDCRLLGDLLRAGLLPEAWISTPEVPEWRELVRYRANFRTGGCAQSAAPPASHWTVGTVMSQFRASS